MATKMIAADQCDKTRNVTPRHDFADSPLVAFYEVTQACDLVCAHCRACAEARTHSNALPTAASRLLLDQLSEFPRKPLLVLTGGDPLKRSDIYQLIEHGTRRGLNVSVTPSATPLVTRSALRRLKDAGVTRVALSLDGADRDTHDVFRGFRGSFERTLDILASAQSLDIPVQVNTTITLTNHQQIDDMADLLTGLRIVLWSVFFLVPVGRGCALPRLSPDEYEDVFERLWQNAQRRSYAIKTTEAPHYRRFVRLKERRSTPRPNDDSSPSRSFCSLGVNDGKGVKFIGHTGLIQPSGFLPIFCGMFPQQHVVDVYQRSPLMKALREPKRLKGKCGQCEFRQICGGSRARAYAVTQDPFAEEPDCIYQPAANLHE